LPELTNQEVAMKKTVSVLTAIVLTGLLASPGFAQNMTAGVKIGVDFADVGGDFEQLIETSTDLKTGFSFGGFLGFDLSEMFRLQGELQYVQKGAKASSEGVDLKFNINYIEILVPVTFMIPTEGGVVPRLYAGPSLAFELDCKVKAEAGGQSEEYACDSQEVGAPTNTTDYGIFFGGGIDIPVGSGAVIFDVFYNLGLGDIAKEDAGDDPVKVTNRNIQIVTGYAFRF
jgi:hypothetical protein